MTNYVDALIVSKDATLTFGKTISVSSEILEECKLQRFIELFKNNPTVTVETI